VDVNCQALKIAVETTELGILAEWCGRSDCLIRIGFELDHFIQRARFRRSRGAVRDWTAQQLEGLILQLYLMLFQKISLNRHYFLHAIAGSPDFLSTDPLVDEQVI